MLNFAGVTCSFRICFCWPIDPLVRWVCSGSFCGTSADKLRGLGSWGMLLFGLARHWIYCTTQWKACNWIINTKWPQCHTYYNYIDQSWIMTNSIMYIICHLSWVIFTYHDITSLPTLSENSHIPCNLMVRRWNNEILLTTGPFSVDIRREKCDQKKWQKLHYWLGCPKRLGSMFSKWVMTPKHIPIYK